MYLKQSQIVTVGYTFLICWATLPVDLKISDFQKKKTKKKPKKKTTKFWRSSVEKCKLQATMMIGGTL